MKTAEIILSDMIHSSLQLDEDELKNMAYALSQIKDQHISFVCETEYQFIIADFMSHLNQLGFQCDFLEEEKLSDEIVFVVETPTLHFNSSIHSHKIISISIYPHSFVDQLSYLSLHLSQSQNDFTLAYLNQVNYKQMIMLIFDSLLMVLSMNKKLE